MIMNYTTLSNRQIFRDTRYHYQKSNQFLIAKIHDILLILIEKMFPQAMSKVPAPKSQYKLLPEVCVLYMYISPKPQNLINTCVLAGMSKCLGSACAIPITFHCDSLNTSHTNSLCCINTTKPRCITKCVDNKSFLNNTHARTHACVCVDLYDMPWNYPCNIANCITKLLIHDSLIMITNFSVSCTDKYCHQIWIAQSFMKDSYLINFMGPRISTGVFKFLQKNFA